MKGGILKVPLQETKILLRLLTVEILQLAHYRFIASSFTSFAVSVCMDTMVTDYKAS